MGNGGREEQGSRDGGEGGVLFLTPRAYNNGWNDHAKAAAAAVAGTEAGVPSATAVATEAPAVIRERA